jgi:ubiquinone/menaquinone biosynthesis C-methylase UbiE
MTKQHEADVHHPLFARFYLRYSHAADKRGAAAHRARLLAGLRGRVVEVGAGDGANFAHYSETVDQVIALEPEPVLRAAAERRTGEAAVQVEVRAGVADSLPLDDQSCDAAVASLVLCTVADQQRALAELYRVLRPGGELRFYEHVVSRQRSIARLQRLADATIYPHLAGGCHAARDTGAAIAAAGFLIETCERFPFKAGALMPTTPHILGTARRPAAR